jgi:hypothetical protein
MYLPQRQPLATTKVGSTGSRVRTAANAANETTSVRGLVRSATEAAFQAARVPNDLTNPVTPWRRDFVAGWPSPERTYSSATSSSVGILRFPRAT